MTNIQRIKKEFLGRRARQDEIIVIGVLKFFEGNFAIKYMHGPSILLVKEITHQAWEKARFDLRREYNTFIEAMWDFCDEL